jgi:hypothetical protein
MPTVSKIRQTTSLIARAVLLTLAMPGWWLVPVAAQATTVTGTIVAARDGLVRVEVPAGDRVAVGDAVQFSTEIRGVAVRAGMGEVSQVETGAVWVQVTGGRPGLGMTATITATGEPTSGSTPSARTDDDVMAARMRANALSLENEYLHRALAAAQNQLDRVQLQRTPEGRATLAGMERLIEATGPDAALVEALGEDPAPRRGLPSGVTEDLATSAETRILAGQIAGVGRYLAQHLSSAGLTPTDDAALARRRLTGGHDDPARAADMIHHMWRVGATEQGLTLQAALRRLPQRARQAVAGEEADLRSTYDAMISSFNRFELAISRRAGDTDTLALVVSETLRRFSDASLRLVEAVERAGAR